MFSCRNKKGHENSYFWKLQRNIIWGLLFYTKFHLLPCSVPFIMEWAPDPVEPVSFLGVFPHIKREQHSLSLGTGKPGRFITICSPCYVEQVWRENTVINGTWHCLSPRFQLPRIVTYIPPFTLASTNCFVLYMFTCIFQPKYIYLFCFSLYCPFLVHLSILNICLNNRTNDQTLQISSFSYFLFWNILPSSCHLRNISCVLSATLKAMATVKLKESITFFFSAV